MRKVLLLVIAVVVLAVGAYGAWYFLRDDTPEDLRVERRDEVDDEAEVGEAPESLDGEWVLAEGDRSRALLAIEEDFTVLPSHTATGEMTGLTGSITIEGDTVTAAAFTVDMTTLSFDDAPAGIDIGGRRNAMENQGLEISQFPEASFTLTQPIELGPEADSGEVVTAEATGELTLHGVTNEITFTVEALLDGDQIQVAAAEAVPIVLADYEIDEPSSPRVARVAPEGTFDVLLVLEQA